MSGIHHRCGMPADTLTAREHVCRIRPSFSSHQHGQGDLNDRVADRPVTVESVTRYLMTMKSGFARAADGSGAVLILNLAQT
jgi:hypothetical protein